MREGSRDVVSQVISTLAPGDRIWVWFVGADERSMEMVGHFEKIEWGVVSLIVSNTGERHSARISKIRDVSRFDGFTPNHGPLPLDLHERPLEGWIQPDGEQKLDDPEDPEIFEVEGDDGLTKVIAAAPRKYWGAGVWGCSHHERYRKFVDKALVELEAASEDDDSTTRRALRQDQAEAWIKLAELSLREHLARRSRGRE